MHANLLLHTVMDYTVSTQGCLLQAILLRLADVRRRRSRRQLVLMTDSIQPATLLLRNSSHAPTVQITFYVWFCAWRALPTQITQTTAELVSSAARPTSVNFANKSHADWHFAQLEFGRMHDTRPKRTRQCEKEHSLWVMRPPRCGLNRQLHPLKHQHQPSINPGGQQRQAPALHQNP